MRRIDIEGYSADEILDLPVEQVDALVLSGRPIVFRAGTAEILGEFKVNIGAGAIKRDARFGYIEMADSLALNQAVRLGDYHYDSTDGIRHITIALQKRFELATGKLIDENPFA